MVLSTIHLPEPIVSTGEKLKTGPNNCHSSKKKTDFYGIINCIEYILNRAKGSHFGHFLDNIESHLSLSNSLNRENP